MDYGSKDYRDTNGYARGIDKGMDMRRFLSRVGIASSLVGLRVAISSIGLIMDIVASLYSIS